MGETLARRPNDAVVPAADGAAVYLQVIAQLLKHGDPGDVDAARNLAQLAQGNVIGGTFAAGVPQAEARPGELERMVPRGSDQPPAQPAAQPSQDTGSNKDRRRRPFSRGGAVAEVVVPMASGGIPVEEAKAKITKNTDRPSGMRKVIILAGAASTALSGTGVGAAAFATSPEAVSADKAACVDGSTDNSGNKQLLIRTGASEGPMRTWKDGLRSMLERYVPGVDNMDTWKEVAAYVTKKQGYDVSAEQLAALNSDGVMNVHDDKPMGVANYVDGQLQDELYRIGPACFKIPGPTVAGQAKTTDKMDTLQMVAKTYGVTTKQLRAWNPGLPAEDTEQLGAGKVIQVAEKLDTGLVLQEVNSAGIDEFIDYSNPKAAGTQFEKVVQYNQDFEARVQQGNGRLTGRFYLPLHRKVAGALAKASPEGKVTIVPTQNTYAKKPETPKEQAPQAKTLSFEERKKLIEGMNLSAEQKVQLTKFVETLAAMPEADLKGVRTDVVLAQAIVSSKWGTAEAAKYNNFFGLKANMGWKGRTVKIAVNDARRDQDQKAVEYRVYDSMADAFKDYVAAIRNSTDFKTHGNDAFVDQAALADLYGGDVLDFRTEYLFQLLMSADFDGKKFKDYQVAGGIGGFIIESAHTLSPEVKEKITPERLAELGREAAEGIGQWQEGRADDREAYRKKHGRDLADDGYFIIYELKHKEAVRLPHLLGARDLESAAIAWREHYERPGAHHDDRRIEEAYYAMAVHARAQAHGAEIDKTIKAHDLAKLAGYAPAAKPAAPASKKPAGQSASGPKVNIKQGAGPIDLQPSKYSEVQDPLPTNKSKGARINADDNPNTGKDGNEVRSSQLTYNQRVQIIERELNQAKAAISPERCQQFQIKDVSKEVRAKFARNFVGSQTGLGGPNKPSDIRHFIVHFTATNTDANDIDGVTFASSMYHSGGLGVNYHINNKGETSLLTKDFTYHAKNFGGTVYNGHSYGVEVSASEQAEINAQQYESIVYLGANFLIEQGFVSKDKPVGDAVKRIIGHREANAASGYHHDFPALIMDQVRGMILDLLLSWGYHQ